MTKLETYEAEIKLDVEDAIEKTNELVSLMDDISPQVVIRGSKDCTFNIYPSVTKVYYGKDERETEKREAE